MDAITAHSLGADIQIVDVREDDEWTAGHVVSACTSHSRDRGHDWPSSTPPAPR